MRPRVGATHPTGGLLVRSGDLTRLSEKDGAWPISVKAAEEMLFTVPSLSCRQ